MANQFEIYKCELCGNVIEVLFAEPDVVIAQGVQLWPAHETYG